MSKENMIEMEATIKQEVDGAFVFAEKSPFPLADELGKDVYTEKVNV